MAPLLGAPKIPVSPRYESQPRRLWQENLLYVIKSIDPFMSGASAIFELEQDVTEDTINQTEVFECGYSFI